MRATPREAQRWPLKRGRFICMAIRRLGGLRFCSRLKLGLQARLCRSWLSNVRFLRTVLAMDVSSLRSEAMKVVGNEDTEALKESRMPGGLGAT